MASKIGTKITTNALDASGTDCPCGCGHKVVKKVWWQKYYSDKCRRRANRSKYLNREKLAIIRKHLGEALEVLAEMDG